MNDALRCTLTSWSPGIGDPTLMGWLTVAAYLATAVLCFRAGRAGRRDRLFWRMLGILMLVLAVNKQLDLQTALTAFGRCVAKAEGWYADRRGVQVAVIGTIIWTVFAVTVIVALLMRRALPRIGLALLGMGALAMFVAVRAVGFHHMDAFIGRSLGPLRANWILELGGIGLIALNAAVRRRRG